MQTATIYIPLPGTPVDHVIRDGSGVVGVPHLVDRHVLYYEGNLHGASSLLRYEERIKHAAGRLFTKYPTIALISVANMDLSQLFMLVGTIDVDYRITWTSEGIAKAYGVGPGSRITTKDGRDFVKNVSGLWTDGVNFRGRFDEPEGTFDVTEYIART